MLGYFFGVNNPNLTIVSILFALGSFLLTIVFGFAHDVQRQAPSMNIKSQGIESHLKNRPTKRVPDWWDSARFQAVSMV